MTKFREIPNDLTWKMCCGAWTTLIFGRGTDIKQRGWDARQRQPPFYLGERSCTKLLCSCPIGVHLFTLPFLSGFITLCEWGIFLTDNGRSAPVLQQRMYNWESIIRSGLKKTDPTTSSIE